MTNREMLAKKNNKELAKWLTGIPNVVQDKCMYCKGQVDNNDECEGCCEDGLAQWLESEVDESSFTTEEKLMSQFWYTKKKTLHL